MLDDGDLINAHKTLLKAGDDKNAREKLATAKQKMYEASIAAYRKGDMIGAKQYFDLLDTYSRSADYRTLIDQSRTSYYTNESDLWNKLVPLIGFENAGDLVFKNHSTATSFMTGKFVAVNGFPHLEIYEYGDSYRATWNMPNVPSGTWHFENGKFYTDDIARFTIYALTKDSVFVRNIKTGDSYTLFRQ